MTSEDPMRVALAAACLAFCVETAFAQTGQAQPTDSPQSTGRTVSPETKGQMQPQGRTGRIDATGSGGAPAESPQGETPSGTEAAPEGSSKTIVEPKR
jgi:hypothetical protein